MTSRVNRCDEDGRDGMKGISIDCKQNPFLFHFLVLHTSTSCSCSSAPPTIPRQIPDVAVFPLDMFDACSKLMAACVAVFADCELHAKINNIWPVEAVVGSMGGQ